MGGAGAPDDLSLAPVTQAWLAVSDDPAATVSGGYFDHQQPREVHPAARSVDVQEGLLERCRQRPAPPCRRRRCCEVGKQAEVAGASRSSRPVRR